MIISSANIDLVIKNGGLKVTRTRKEVLQVLFDHINNPLSIDEILEKLPEGFDRVTAYRVIHDFADHGIIEKLNHLSSHLKVLLSPKLKKNHHHIVTCRICGNTVTANICVQAGWQEKLSHLGFKDLSHHLSFSGVCSQH